MLAGDIVNATATAAFSRGPDGGITAWNGAAEILMSVPVDKALGRRCHEVIEGFDVFGNDFCCESCNCWRMATANRPIQPYRLLVAGATGRRIELRVSILPAEGANGPELVHLIELSTDTGHTSPAPVELDDGDAALECVPARLTPRELEVLRHLAQGHGTNETAQRLEISPTTVRNHIARCLQKLDAHSRLEAVAVGRGHGLV